MLSCPETGTGEIACGNYAFVTCDWLNNAKNSIWKPSLMIWPWQNNLNLLWERYLNDLILRAYLLNFRCCGPKKLNISRSHDLFVLLQCFLSILLFRKQNESVTFKKSSRTCFKTGLNLVNLLGAYLGAQIRALISAYRFLRIGPERTRGIEYYLPSSDTQHNIEQVVKLKKKYKFAIWWLNCLRIWLFMQFTFIFIQLAICPLFSNWLAYFHC